MILNKTTYIYLRQFQVLKHSLNVKVKELGLKKATLLFELANKG